MSARSGPYLMAVAFDIFVETPGICSSAKLDKASTGMPLMSATKCF